MNVTTLFPYKNQELDASPESCFIFSRVLESRVTKQLLSESPKYSVFLK